MNSEFQRLPLETQEAVKKTMDTMEPAQTPAEIRETLEGTQKGGVKNSIRNCLTVFQRDPLFRGALRLNLLTEQIDIVKPLGWERTSTTLTDMDMNYLLLYLEENYGLISEKKVQSAIKIVANENRYHPVRDYLNSLQWDGTERIRYALHHFLGADTDEYTYEALKLFLMGAIRRVFRPGSKFEVMLCLVGGQGAGKSTFFRLLAGRDEWFSDDLKKLDDENVYRKLQGHWIIEMSEMIATANAKSIEEIKSFLSRQKETYKVPYETHPADRLRQCVFGGTTNRQDFLPRDRTGNRRFLPVTVYPPDGSHQEQFQGFISVFVRIGSQKVMQGITDALCAVPLQVVQVIPDRMVAVFIGNNLDGALHLFLAGKPVIFFQIQKQVVHVHVGQRGTGALPAQRLHNVNLLRQKVQAQRPAKQRVTLEHRQAVSDAVLHAAFLRPL